jgi:hypothetical protein
MDQQVDEQTYNTLINFIDEFLAVSPFAKKFILTDKEYIKILFETAFCYPHQEINASWEDRVKKRVNVQMLAPLIISVYCTDSFDANWIHIGRLYSKLALFALEQGYHIGFCNGINYPMVKRFFSPKQFPIECQQHTFLSIGNKLKSDSPHNWSHVTNSLLPSFKRPSDEFIQILN